MLAAGGNAFDAAVAAGFAAAVAEPVLSSLGGGGFLLARTGAGEEVLFDFFVDTPGRGVPDDIEPSLVPVTLRFGAADQVFHVGHGSVAVPGCLAGYLHVHRRLGRLPLGQVVAPARRLAEQGVVLGAAQVAVAHLVDPILSLTTHGRQRFHPGGRPLTADSLVADPLLAAFLDDVAQGRVTSFADAGVATRIEEVSRAGGGLVTAADLAAYTVHEREPLRTRYRDATLVSNPPPSLGAGLVAAALAALERAGPPLAADEDGRLVRLLAGLRAMTVARGAEAGPPSVDDAVVPDAAVVPDEATAPGRSPDRDAVEHVAPRPGRHGAGRSDDGTTTGTPVSTKGTTHVSVSDGEGNLAAMTTSNGSGSGVLLGDTSVLANNIMGEEDLHPSGARLGRLRAGVRVGSMMAPSLLDRPGRPTVVLGSGGSERIRSALVQTIVRLVDEDAPLRVAVEAARIHLDAAGTVQVEPGHPPSAVADLRTVEPDVNVWEVSDLYFGGVHAVDTEGAHAGDPRRGGATATLP